MNTDDLETRFQTALRHQSEGRYQEALSAYEAIIKVRSDIAEVHFQVGRIFLIHVEFEKAVNHLNAAQRIRPDEPAIWQLYVPALLGLGDRDRKSSALKALKASPLPTAARQTLASRLTSTRKKSNAPIGKANPKQIERLFAHLRSGSHDLAESLARRLRRQHPGVALFPNALGLIQKSRGQSAEARASFEAALAIDGNYAEAFVNLGRLHLEAGECIAAGEALVRALELTPGSPNVLTSLGLLARAARPKSRDAVSFFRRAVKADSGFAEAILELGREHLTQERFMEARDCLRRARRLGIESPNLLLALARAEENTGGSEAAHACYDRILQTTPDHAVACSRKAVLCQLLGDFKLAESLLLKAIELEPHCGEHFRHLSASHRFCDDDPLIPRMIGAFERTEISDEDRMGFGFALAKAMEDCGRTGEVFRYLSTANKIMRTLYPYDIKERVDDNRRIKAFFGSGIPAPLADGGYRGFAPIFVTGLPRSGTTLVEQILSSHSSVEGAGELGHFNREAARMTIFSKSASSLEGLAPRDLVNLGQAYKAHVRSLYPTAARVTDKSIQTYMFIGLVPLSLPNARIVVVRRNPRDNLFSMYKNRFPLGGHLYSYDLEDLAAYYRLYEEILDFWRETFPGSFVEVSYDDLVANPEPQIRSLLSSCDLDWDDACLAFHRNRRTVRTLSVFQVRQPIYASSVGGWKAYESELKPVFDRLGIN